MKIWNVVFIYSSILLYLSSENICPCASFHIIFIDEINRKWKNFHYHWHVTSTVSFSHIKADTWMRVDFRRTNQDMNKQKSKPSNRKNKTQDWSPLQPLQDRRPTRSWLPSQVRRSGCCWAEKDQSRFISISMTSASEKLKATVVRQKRDKVASASQFLCVRQNPYGD